MVFTLEGADKGYLTCVLEVDVIAIVCVLQFVGHHAESHDLLPDERVGPRDVHAHLWVVSLQECPHSAGMEVSYPKASSEACSWLSITQAETYGWNLSLASQGFKICEKKLSISKFTFC